MFKPAFILSILFFGQQLSAQCQSKFEFWISSLDKASYKRVTYHINGDSITIKSGPYDFIYFAKNYEKDKIVYKIDIDSADKEKLYKLSVALKNDSLKTQYTNLCIIDGMILHFHFEWDDKMKSTTLSNFYLAAMTPFVDFVNKIVSDKYKIWYDKEWLNKVRKECPSDRILD